MKKTADGIPIGNLIWATGNLSYNSGVYSIDETPILDNADCAARLYWQISSNIPDLGEKPDYSLYIDAYNNLDAGWRLPSMAEYIALGAPFGSINQSGNIGSTPAPYIYVTAPSGEQLKFYKGGWRIYDF
ncbi:hypothetical protein CMT37_09105 [Elizabethkingia anophelis]|nr:hypothetical protein [Elizabethkingia anophelis]